MKPSYFIMLLVTAGLAIYLTLYSSSAPASSGETCIAIWEKLNQSHPVATSIQRVDLKHGGIEFEVYMMGDEITPEQRRFTMWVIRESDEFLVRHANLLPKGSINKIRLVIGHWQPSLTLGDALNLSINYYPGVEKDENESKGMLYHELGHIISGLQLEEAFKLTHIPKVYYKVGKFAMESTFWTELKRSANWEFRLDGFSNRTYTDSEKETLKLIEPINLKAQEAFSNLLKAE